MNTTSAMQGIFGASLSDVVASDAIKNSNGNEVHRK